MRLIGCGGIALILLATVTSLARAEIDLESVVGLWLFDEGEGETVNDLSGNENHGTFNGTPEWTEGVFEGALNCATGGHVLIKDSDSLDLDAAWTLTLWVNINPPMERWQTILNKRFDTATNYVIRLQNTGAWEVMVNNGGWVRVGDPNPARGGEWVHLAGVYDGQDTLSLFVDAEQVATRSGVAPAPVNNIDLRLGSYSGNSGGIDGMIDETAIFNVALEPEDITLIKEEGLAAALDLGGAGAAKARSPSPKDGAVLETTSASLSWKSGSFAVRHDVYIESDFDGVNEASRDSGSFAGTVALEQFVVGVPGHPFPEGLEPGATYYWRIDEVNDANAASPWKGNVWSFTVRPLIAWGPLPSDTMKFVGTDGELSWQAGMGALIHTVYLGESFDEVRDATTGGTMSATTTYDPGLLKPDTTYYWRVDEFTFPANVTHKGDVWSFTTLGAGGGVKAEYFAGMDLAGEPVLTRVEDAIDHEWADEIVAGLSDQVSARWTADLEAPLTDTYTLTTRSDDGVRLWLDGALIIDNWTNHAAADNRAAVALTAGEIYSVRMDWYEDGGGAVAQLSWESPSMSRRIIPGGALQPPRRAGMPSPANGDAEAPRTVTLSWSAGDGAVQHRLHFGDDAAMVASATTPTAEQALDDTTYDVGALEWGQTYFWRVDEVQADGTVLTGKVWSFTTAAYLVIDDFEAYGNEVGSRPFEVWIDGIGFTLPEPGHPGNGTGAAVGHDIWDPESAEYAASIIEWDVIHGGYQSMPLYYDNSETPWYSEAERTWAVPQDWSVHGLDALSLWVRGSVGNDPDPLYVRLTDVAGNAAVVTYPGEKPVTSTRWTEWQIPFASFSGVDPTQVQRLSIGLGSRNAPTPGGAGLIYIDDIRATRE